MFKKIFALILALATVFSIAACNKDKPQKQTEEVLVPEKKVAILVAPQEQYPEDYNAAKALAEKYPDKVVVKEYPDSRVLVAGDSQIITISEEIAKDNSFGAIIYARATQFTIDAINKAKKANPDILTVCLEPEEPLSRISSLADLVICADWAKAAKDIVASAKAAKAEYFVMLSFNRHLNNELYKGLRSAIEAACKESEITYVYDNAADTNSAGGAATTVRYITEVIPRLVNNKKIAGENVAFFSTDSSVQAELVRQAQAKGFIYICPSFPTAYNGIGEAYTVQYNKDTSAYVEALKAAAAANAQGKGRLSAYTFPLASVMLEGALNTVFDMLGGKTTADNMADRVTMRLNDAAGSDKFSSGAFSEDYKNVFTAYAADSFAAL